MARKQDGADKFDAHFAAVYGDRWPGLRRALATPSTKVELKNPFGLSPYVLDAASTLPVQLLNLAPGQRIADFCASPGGKLLRGIFQLQGAAEWHAYDLSKSRMARLRAVLHGCLPQEILARVRNQCLDASLLGKRKVGPFDRILVDAPCSGERHLLASPTELSRWSLKGSQRLAVRQHALLCAAVDVAAPGARIVYSTCSLSPVENDGVIATLLKRRKGKVEVVRDHIWISGAWPPLLPEPTEHGWIVLPDRSQAGPIYAAVLKKCQ